MYRNEPAHGWYEASGILSLLMTIILLVMFNKPRWWFRDRNHNLQVSQLFCCLHTVQQWSLCRRGHQKPEWQVCKLLTGVSEGCMKSSTHRAVKFLPPFPPLFWLPLPAAGPAKCPGKCFLTCGLWNNKTEEHKCFYFVRSEQSKSMCSHAADPYELCIQCFHHIIQK